MNMSASFGSTVPILKIHNTRIPYMYSCFDTKSMHREDNQCTQPLRNYNCDSVTGNVVLIVVNINGISNDDFIGDGFSDNNSGRLVLGRSSSD